MNQPSPYGYETALRDGVAKIVAGYMSEGSADITALSRALIDLAEAYLATISAQQPPPRPLACKAGCHFCCHNFQVHLSPIELFGIVQTLRATLNIEALVPSLQSALAMREAALREDTGQLFFPCPLLEDGKCRVYAARPFICRGFNAYDASVCEQRKIDHQVDLAIEGYGHPLRIAQCLLAGIELGLKREKRTGHVLDLTGALLIAFTEPNVEARWQAGEDPFAAAKGLSPPT
ncbi:YkgJ family cysteine cluster protein [Magnetospira sp. QH-2]|uniref:YkgJ family cysteine cluster protein n=1 Tax=Magnetospira sp. (strain QH-2) TaxID=1288970 RepID=UPI0003E81BB2|nr:YkgJ family cysteine cluster protein [Magnetospira sp. QH-2]CCQ73734.1 Conserved protein of unknown function [Magnetospira sp. QH-2]